MVKGNKYRRNEAGIAILSRNIRKYRGIAGLTQTDLAGKLDIDYAYVGRIERGVGNPTVSMIFDIAAALNVKPAQLVEKEEEAG